MEIADLNWDCLTGMLRSRSIARHSRHILEGARAELHNVNQEVAAIACSKSGRHSKSSKSSGHYSADDESDANRVSSHRSRKYGKDRFKGHGRSSSKSSRDSSTDSYGNKSRKSSSRSNSKSSSKKSGRCYACGIRGHEIRYCPEVRCFYCNHRGHTQKDCKRYKEKYGNRTSDSDTSSSGSSPTRRVRFAESRNVS